MSQLLTIVRVYVGGEVQRPGYYLSDEQGVVQPQQVKSALQANSINLSTELPEIAGEKIKFHRVCGSENRGPKN